MVFRLNARCTPETTTEKNRLNRLVELCGSSSQKHSPYGVLVQPRAEAACLFLRVSLPSSSGGKHENRQLTTQRRVVTPESRLRRLAMVTVCARRKCAPMEARSMRISLGRCFPIPPRWGRNAGNDSSDRCRVWCCGGFRQNFRRKGFTQQRKKNTGFLLADDAGCRCVVPL